MNTRIPFVLVIIASLGAIDAGAAQKWGPTWSEVTGVRYSKVKMNLEAAVISKVDGKSYTDRVVKVAPGPREIVVRSPMRKGFSGSDETMHLDLRPCYRYYINAQFESGTGTDWQPVVTVQERIPGCKMPPSA